MEVSTSTRIFAIVTFIIYAVVCVVLGNVVSRKAKKGQGFGKSYFAGGGNMNFLAAGFMIAASFASGGTFLSNPGLAHAWGLMWPVCIATFTFSGLIAASIINKKLKIVCNRINAVSLGAVLQNRYGNNKFIAWYTPISIILFTGLFLYQQMTSGARLMETMTGLPYVWGLVIFGVILLAYTVVGGSKGTAAVSIFQGFVMTVTTVVLAIGIVSYVGGHFGSLENAFRDLAATSPTSVSPVANFSFAIVACYLFQIGVSGNIGKDNVAQAVKIGDSKSLHNSTAITLAFVGLWSIVMPTLGTVGKTVFPDVVPDTIIPTAALTVLPPVFAGIVASGVVAAIQSTIAFQLLNVNSCVVMDIYGGLIKKGKASDEQLKKVNTAAVVVVVAITVLFAIKPPALIGVINNFTIAGGACAFFMPVLFGTWWKRANKYGCIASMILGIGYYLLSTVFPALTFGLLPLVPSLVIACVAMVVVSLLTPAPDAQTLDVWFGVGRSVVPAKTGNG